MKFKKTNFKRYAVQAKPFIPYVLGFFFILFIIRYFKKSLDLGKNEGKDSIDTKDQNRTKELANNADKDFKKQYDLQKPTKTDAEFLQLADAIDDLTDNSTVANNYDAATFKLCTVKNQSDVFKLITAFGKRWRFTFGIPTSQDSLVNRVNGFPKQKVHSINDNYRRKGIAFRF